MATIKTLVYFDLEATGLKSSGRPRISELSFVAVNAQETEISETLEKVSVSTTFAQSRPVSVSTTLKISSLEKSWSRHLLLDSLSMNYMEYQYYHAYS